MLRIMCRHCETESGDGVEAIDHLQWFGVIEVQSIEEAQATEPHVFNIRKFSLLDWHTHEATCLDCERKEAERLLGFQ